MAAKNVRQKGKAGEREVVELWRAHGWPRAARSPGSGAVRPYGAGDMSPWPGDLFGTRPWLVEVKFDEKVKAHSRGWEGEAFIRSTLKGLAKLSLRHNAVVGAGRVLPVLFARGTLRAWRVFVPSPLFVARFGGSPNHSDVSWTEIDVEDFFEHFARAEAQDSAA